MVELRLDQKAVVREQIARDHLLVVAPMGAGKTLATLCVVANLIYKGKVKNVLIIAPKRVAMSVWQQENEKYDLGLNARFCVKAVEIKLFLTEPAQHHVCICSVTRIAEIPHGCWDMVILDESTLFGNKTSIRSREVRRICNKVRRVVELTGTPIHGGYEKLWHQIFLLDGGKALGKNLTEFRSKYMRVKYQLAGVTTVYEVNPFMIPTLINDIKHLIFIVKDTIKLPPILVKDIFIDLPAKRRREYDEFEKTSIIGFEADTGMTAYSSEHSLVAFASSARCMKLRQLASGCVYTRETYEHEVRDNSKYDYTVTHREKIEAVKEIVEVAERGVMVVYQFQSELNELKKTFPQGHTLDNSDVIDNWNKGDIPIIFVHPAGAGWGLNLQFGGNIIVWFSPTYDAELYAQLNKRLHRSGQRDSVSLIRLIARNTIDEKMIKVLEVKEHNAKEFLKQ